VYFLFAPDAEARRLFGAPLLPTLESGTTFRLAPSRSSAGDLLEYHVENFFGMVRVGRMQILLRYLCAITHTATPPWREVWCLIRSADSAHQRCRLAPVSLTASSRRLSVESEQIRDWHLESSSHALELFKRGSIPSPLDQAKKIHRHPYHLGKVFLTLPQIMPDLEESKAELLSEAVQN
jgi:hypothetical protein